MKRIAVLGGGAWGTALAQIAAADGEETPLWVRARADALRNDGENRRNLPGVALSPHLQPLDSLSDALNGADAVLLVTPAQTLHSLAGEADALTQPGAPFVVCAKGVDRSSGLTTFEAAQAAAPGRPIMILSGPTFARDAAMGAPTACVLAASADDQMLVDALAARLATSSFRIYPGADPLGVALCGAAKNVIAIACGAAIGRGLGENARAALISRGLAEIGRLSAALGGAMETLAGLAGVGDLALTCASETSRNYAFGLALGLGGDLAAAQAACAPHVVEGALTAEPLLDRAVALGVDLPICAAVHAVTSGAGSLDDAIAGLLSRPPRLGMAG